MAEKGKWSGWVAALGGLVSIIGLYAGASSTWLVWLGGLIAIVFGIWAVYQ
jgi:hypothetical protein